MTNLNLMADDWKINDQADGFNDNPESKPPLNKNQKIAAASLAVFAVLIVILWSAQLKSNIYGPLNSDSTGTNETAQIDDQAASDLALKNKDTDSDGLSDYDELYFYKTSPYLEDSDGDTVKDGEEINKGADPNCPTGRTCANSTSNGSSADTGSGAPAASTDTINSLLNQFNAASPAADSGSQPVGTGTDSLTAEEKEMLKSIDVASLRQLLLENGMDKATLDQISDADLMQSYSETLQ